MDCKLQRILDNGNQLKSVNGTSFGAAPFTPAVVAQTQHHHQQQQAPLLPIDDFHLLENPNKYSDEEKQLRIKLTAVYRLIEQAGWSMGIYNHVTVSVIPWKHLHRGRPSPLTTKGGAGAHYPSLAGQPTAEAVVFSDDRRHHTHSRRSAGTITTLMSLRTIFHPHTDL